MAGRRFRPVLLLLAATLPASQARADALIDQCQAATCIARLTPDQLVHEAEALVGQRRFGEAQPLIAALATLPDRKLEARFLAGYAAQAQGDSATARRYYQAILADDPGQTRVRLELARVMLAQGATASADHQFRLAEQTNDLPPEIARTVRGVRDAIRSQRAWRMDVDLGLAPDSNINNATAADSVTVNFGGASIPVTLDADARARSGLGLTGSVSSGLRLPLSGGASLLVDLDALGTNYAGHAYDDYTTELAAGPQFRLSQGTSLTFQAVGSQRWYGGDVLSRQAGARVIAEHAFDNVSRATLRFDGRRMGAQFDANYSGWQVAAQASYDRALTRTIIGSAGLFARRDALAAGTVSSTELGVSLGAGGELPWGFSVGVGGSVSRARFDEAMPFFGEAPRADWRLGARVSVGNRKLRVMGFSPQLSWTYSDLDSTLPLYSARRSRFRLAAARYF